MSDKVLFAGILIFLFVLWVYTGGPNHPISFAGPYLTPITDIGQESVGYGPSANTYLKSQYTDGGRRDIEITDTAASPYAGEVYLGSGDMETSNVRSEYIRIRSNSSDDITITGWQVVSAKNGTQVRIPEGKRRNSGSERTVRLTEDDDEAIIITGSRASDDLKDSYSQAWHVYLDRSRDLWRNSGDTITLLDQNGKVVDQYEY